MDDLKNTKLARPLDRTALSNDLAGLERLARELNNPELTGAVVPAEERLANPAIAPANTRGPIVPPTPAAALEIPKLPGESARPAFAPPPQVPQINPVQATSSFSLPPGTRKVFFTGHNKSGKSWLAVQIGARVVELEDPIRAMAASSFGSSAQEADLQPFLQEVFAWGEGIVNKSWPLTGARAIYIEAIRGLKDTGLFGVPFEEFGTAGFWGRSLIARTTAFLKEFPQEKVITTGVFDGGQYQQLRENGFVPIHVACNNVTRTARGGTGVLNPLAEGIERDLVKKISASPSGPKLWAVWCDEQYAPSSRRLLTTQEFITACHAL